MMKKRRLGATGICVSEIGFGAVEIGIPYGFGADRGNLLPEQEALTLLDLAFSSGITLYDTAREYGWSQIDLWGRLKDGHFRAASGTYRGGANAAELIKRYGEMDFKQAAAAGLPGLTAWFSMRVADKLGMSPEDAMAFNTKYFSGWDGSERESRTSRSNPTAE